MHITSIVEPPVTVTRLFRRMRRRRVSLRARGCGGMARCVSGTRRLTRSVIMSSCHHDLTSDQVFEGNYEAGTPHGYFRHINGYGDLEFFGCFHRGTLLGETFIMRGSQLMLMLPHLTRRVLEVSARRWVPGVQVLELHRPALAVPVPGLQDRAPGLLHWGEAGGGQGG